MQKILSFFCLGNIGLLEFLFALFPILTGYQYGSLPVGLLTMLIADILAMLKPTVEKERVVTKTLKWCVVYTIVHQLCLYVMIGSAHPYLGNNIIQLAITTCSVFIIAPKLDYDKFINSIMWVAIISAGGIIYHFIQLQAGQICHPIKLPFMPEIKGESRLYEDLYRPTSFFWEPAAFITYMMFPFFIHLNNKNYVLAGLFFFFILLSTSTTGIAIGFTLLATYILTQDVKKRYKIVVAVLTVFMGWFLLNSSLFELGIDKINSTQLDENMRIINGPLFVFGMDKLHWLLGIPSGSFMDYLKHHNISGLMYQEDSIFISTFWCIWAKWGLISLILYLFYYWKIAECCRSMIPYVICLVVAMFTQSIPYNNPTFFFQMTCILVFVRQYSKATSSLR